MAQPKEKQLASCIGLPLLAVFVVLFYFHYLSGSFYIWEDLLHWYYPSAKYFCTSLANGRFPLWLPGLFDGVPYYTDIESSVFYPPMWLMVPFAHGGIVFWLVYQWYIVLHIFLGATFMFLFLRNRRLHFWSCLLGTVIFCFSGFTSLHIIHFPMLQVYAWLPLQLMLVDKAVETGRVKFYAWLTVAILMSFLAGFPQTTFYDSLLVASYWLFVRDRRPAGVEGPANPGYFRWIGREALKMTGVYVSVLLLAAFMALPTLEHWRLSVRHDIPFDGIAVQSMPWYYLIHLAVPKFFGCFNDLQIGAQFWGGDLSQPDVASNNLHGYWQYWEFGAYAGQIFLLAIVVFLFHWRETRGTPLRFFVVVAGLALWFMLGRHGGLYTVFYHILPGTSMFRGPSRMASVLDFAAAVLAAYLLEFALARRIPRVGRALQAVLVMAVSGTLAFFIFGRLLFPPMRVGLRASFAAQQIWISIGFLVALAFCLWTIQHMKARWTCQIACWTVALLTFDDLYHAHNLFHRGVSDPDRYFSENMAIIQNYERAVRNFGPMRFTQMMSNRYAEILVDANTPMLMPEMETHRGYLNFQPREVARLAQLTNVDTRLDLQNVAFAARLSSDGKHSRWTIRTNALPRVAFYTNVRRYKTEEAIFDDLQAGRIPYHTTAAVLDGDLESSFLSVPTTNTFPFRLTIKSVSPEEYTVDYAVKHAGLMVVNETFFPGWEVVDEHGQSYRIIRTFLALKGVVIPKPGEGRLTFRFRPQSFRIGGIISGVAFLLIVSVYAALIYRERHRRCAPAPSAPQPDMVSGQQLA